MTEQHGLQKSFRLKKGVSIGEPDAESDHKFLERCFTDTGYAETLIDCTTPQRIIVGRTGSGKSALIYQIKRSQENVIEISPEDLSLNFIANSDILKTLEGAGVKLDIFYNLLWKHVFAVELLKAKFNLRTEEDTRTWLSGFLSMFRKKDQSKERALCYLRDWGDKFWEETEYRIKEVTEKLEKNIKATLGAEMDCLRASADGESKQGREIRSEVVHKAQRVINDIQIKALSDVLKLLAEDIFEDKQQHYYIVIDKLDENWVEDQLRYRLIRALIETVRSFRTIRSVKIVVALRQDLIQSVFEATRDSGFQEEKYESLFLRIRWSPKDLEKLLDSRVRALVREQYTSKSLGLKDIFPQKIGGTEFCDYIIPRTLLRPRDAIAFLNECLRRSEGNGSVTVQSVRDSENEYSARRIDSLCHEWISHYPLLRKYLTLLERMPSHFKVSSISRDRIESLALEIASEHSSDRDPIVQAAQKVINGQSLHAFLIQWVKTLFHVGVVGVKPDSFTRAQWDYNDDNIPTDGQIKPSSLVYLHPILWARLGVEWGRA